MKSFGELLSEYINQTGVSDAELARRLGISRQTVFRWREGLTQRPRHREDVLRMAEMLRLSPAERDQLLLAGGFPPDQPQPADSQLDGGKQIVRALQERWRIAALGLLVVLAIAVGFPTGFWAQRAADLGLV